MKCKEYLELIMENFKKHGDSFRYDIALESMCYICEDYNEYILSLDKKNQI